MTDHVHHHEMTVELMDRQHRRVEARFVVEEVAGYVIIDHYANGEHLGTVKLPPAVAIWVASCVPSPADADAHAEEVAAAPHRRQRLGSNGSQYSSAQWGLIKALSLEENQK